MSNVKIKNSTVRFSSHPLIIKANTTFTQTVKTVHKNTKADFVLVEKPRTHQMAGVLAARLIGKKFIWIQKFSNPPSPSFFEKLLLQQADKIMVNNQKDIKKLENLGVSKSKVKFLKKRI